MSKLQELLDQYCPNGVEKKPLGSLCSIATGKGVTKKDIVDDGEYDIISGGVIPLGRIDRHNRDGKAVTIARAGSAGYVDWHEDAFYLNDKCFSVIPSNPALLDSKFLYYSLKNQEPKIMAMKSDGSVPTVNTEKVSKIVVPVPPIEVQREIVRILDSFTELTTELTTELAARRKQYEYYRDTLLDFDNADPNSWPGKMMAKYCPDGVKFVTLGKIGKFYGGLTGKSKEDFRDGNACFITYRNVYSNPALDIYPDDRVKIGDGENQRVLEYGDVVFTGSSETPDECGFSSVVVQQPTEPLYLNSFCFFLRMDDLELFDPAFMKHLFRSSSMRHQIRKTASGVTRFNVSKEKMAKVRIPVPPLELQREIVKVLDRFSSLCSDVSSGLPAEIAARQKQYEYYRGRLLSF